MLDERVRAVLARLEHEPREPPAVSVPPATGRFLFALVAPHSDCNVLELGGGKGYSSIWLAAGVRSLGGRVLSIEREAEIATAWRANVAEAGLEDTGADRGRRAGRGAGDRRSLRRRLPRRSGQAVRGAIPARSAEARAGRARHGNNVLSREEILGPYSRARQSDPTLESVTVPVGEGVELSVILSQRLQ